MSDSKPDRWAIAFCAPERETDATVALFRAGEKAAEVRPTRFLAGSSTVIVASKPEFELPPFEFTPPSLPSLSDRLLADRLARTLPPPFPPWLVTGV